MDIQNIIYHQTNTWPDKEEIKKASNEDVFHFIHKVFLKGMLGEIKRVMANSHDGKEKCGGVGHIVLISICCAIDSISSYFLPEILKKDKNSDHEKRKYFFEHSPFVDEKDWRLGDSKARYINFIKRFFDKKYEPKCENIYGCFRCASVHGWNLHRSSISGESEDKNHLTIFENGVIHISLYDFFNDFESAVTKYANQLKNDADLLANFIKRYENERKNLGAE